MTGRGGAGEGEFDRCALAPAPTTTQVRYNNGIIEYGFQYGAAVMAPLNVIDNIVKRKGQVERKIMINICVCGLLLLLIIRLFGYLTCVYGLFAALFAAFISSIIGLKIGLFRNTIAPFIGVHITHNNRFVGGLFEGIFNGLFDGLIGHICGPLIRAFLAIFIGFSNGLTCPRMNNNTKQKEVWCKPRKNTRRAAAVTVTATMIVIAKQLQ